MSGWAWAVPGGARACGAEPHTTNRKPVANRDLWEPLIEEYPVRRSDVAFRWVKGHSGDEWNAIAGQLATGAAADQRARRGR